MTETELMKRIQELADKVSENFPAKRKAKLELIYSERQEDGSTDHYCVGSDMPLLIYRIFNEKEDGTIVEITDVQSIVEKSRHYNDEVVKELGIEKAPLITGEKNEYEILVENLMDNNGVEIKLKSSVGRDITMIEIFRYFDYVTKIYFVSCVAPSFGAQYLFSVTTDSKHLKLIIGNNQEIKARIDMINELLRNKLLPSHKTIEAGAKLLTDKNVHAHIKLNDQDGKTLEFDSTFCYDDPETQSRYAFFAKAGDPKNGVILIQDVFTQKLILSNEWSEEQKAAVDRIKALMKDNPDEFNKHTTSFFSDDLDFRYNAFKNGTLTLENLENANESTTEETK